ncbi:MAG: helix-turn-helix domain-containing protein [Bacteroidota bacterium]
MIPTHDISEAEKKEIRMNELLTLTHYDSSEPHRHGYFEFFVFLKGGGTHIIDFIEFPIHSHAIHIVAPGQVHQVRRELDSQGFVFLFEQNRFGSFQKTEHFLADHNFFDVSECPPAYHLANESEELEYLVKQCWKEYCSEDVFRGEFVFNKLSQLLLLCMRNRFPAGESALKGDGTYAAFRRLLSQEFRTMKKVKDYALALSLTEKQLNEITRQRSGETAASLIYKQVILEAKRLLNTGISAKQAAYELNFIDPAHFSKFFKAQTGLSPSDFKNVHA